jgi:glycerol-3-phosphate cytidylyltransferase
MIYCFDLDNTLCYTNGNNYLSSVPNYEIINKVNHLYDKGEQIHIFTARGMTTCKGDIHLVYNKYYELTKKQLDEWGVRYHRIILSKPSFDIFIDDKNKLISDFRKEILPKKGFIAGSFDIIHPGYIEMFEFIKQRCDYFIVGLHKDPSVERPTKLKPILSVEERKKTLMSIKYIDEVVVYETESELIEMLSNGIADVRFLGDDYKDKDFNGSHLPLEIIYVNREHNWSTTKFKNLISEDILKKIENR